VHARGLGWLFTLVFLVAASGAILITEARLQARPTCAEDFQRLLGGVGFGPNLDLSESAGNFDPRLNGDFAGPGALIPGGGYFSDQRGLSIFSYPRLDFGGR
jgi:hypothetical protein